MRRLIARWKYHRALARRRKLRAMLTETLASYASYGWNMERQDTTKMRREMLRELHKVFLR